jgi:hypothetical protein
MESGNKITIGKLIYSLIYQPTAKIRYYIGHFGIKGWFDLVKGEKAMRQSAINAKSIPLSININNITFSYLTGERYLYQTIYGIKSLDNLIHKQFKVDIYSDGTLI